MPPMANPIRRIGQLSRVKLFVIVTLIGGTVWGLLAIGFFGMNTLTGLRGYVNGEGLWAKHQKDATHYLMRYIHNGDRADYHAFRAKLDVIRGVERSRDELEKAEPDMAVVSRGFSDLGLHRDDHEQMSKVFRRFRNFEHMETAIEIWTRGDRMIDELEALGERLHAAMAEPDYDLEERYEANTLQILELNISLGALEAEFSAAAGKAARWATALLVKVMVGFCLLASAVCGLLILLGAGVIRKVEDHAVELRRAGPADLSPVR